MIDYTLPFDAYLQLDAVSSTELKHILVSAAEYYHRKHFASKEDTQATKLGTAIHAAILEPEAFDKNYVWETEKIENKVSGDGRKAWDSFKKEHAGKHILSYDDGLKIHVLRDQVLKESPLLTEILSQGVAEVSATADLDGIPCKARTDFLTLDNAMWDIKTTSEDIFTGDNRIERLISKWLYHLQMAHHMAVFEANGVAVKSYGWIFVTTQTEVPYIYIVMASSLLVEYAKQAHLSCLYKLKKCMETNNWHGLEQHEIHEVSLLYAQQKKLPGFR